MKRKLKFWLPIVIPLVLLLLYTGYTVWFREYIRYRFTEGMEERENGGYIIIQDGEIYRCNLPAIFFGGQSLGITSTREYLVGEGTPDGPVNEYYTATVPFKFFTNEWEVDVVLGYKDEDGKVQSAIFYLDEHMNPLNEKEMSAVELQKYDELKPRIEELYRKIYDMWGICNIDE